MGLLSMRAGWLRDNALFIVTAAQLLIVLSVFAVFSVNYFDENSVHLNGQFYYKRNIWEVVKDL